MFPSSVLMISPAKFGFNPQTAVNNSFQSDDSNIDDTQIQELAEIEFSVFVNILRSIRVDVEVFKDSAEPLTPDAIFPNNWISFHETGEIVLYPMFALNRRLERRMDIVEHCKKSAGFTKVIDLSYYEEKGLYLEGTGSMVLDRENKIAYACKSARTSKEVFMVFCAKLGYTPVFFEAANEDGGEIYHTNVLMTIGNGFSLVCLDAVQGRDSQNEIITSLALNGKEIIPISIAQMNAFAGNMLQVFNKRDQSYLVMSKTAYGALTAAQIARIEAHANPLIVPLGTIEKFGGGSARCMLAAMS